MEEMPSLNTPVQRLKVAILPVDLPCSGPVTHSGEILTTGKSHGKKPTCSRANFNILQIIYTCITWQKIMFLYRFWIWYCCYILAAQLCPPSTAADRSHICSKYSCCIQILVLQPNNVLYLFSFWARNYPSPWYSHSSEAKNHSDSYKSLHCLIQKSFPEILSRATWNHTTILYILFVGLILILRSVLFNP